MTQFYIPDIDKNSEEVIISSEETLHIIKSYRVKTGERIKLFNGVGDVFYGIVKKIADNVLTVKILEKKENKIVLCQSIIKIKNFELVIRKTTELGIDTIVPLLTSRCEVDKDNFVKKYDRFYKIIIEASKQSERPYLTELTYPCNIEECFKHKNNTKVYNIIAYKNSSQTNLLKILQQIKYSNTKFNIRLFIGPEGDFTNSEINFFLNQKDTFFVNLADTILCSETAGILLSGLVVYYINNI